MLGNLSEFALPDIFQMFERSGKTGRLSIWALAGRHRIFFYQGRILAAISPEPQYALKRILLDSGALSDEAIQFVKRRSELSEPLGKSLKKQNLVDASLLASAFRTQIQMGVYPLFHLETGQFRFAAQVPIPYEEMTGMSKSSIEVAIHGLRQCETLLPPSDLPLPDSRFRRVSAELPILKLSSLEWSVLENAAPVYTIRDLSQLLNCEVLEVRQICGRLAKVSLLQEVQPAQPREVSVADAGEAGVIADAMKQRLQGMAQTGLPEQTLAAKGSQPEKGAVNANLLTRFATMLKSL